MINIKLCEPFDENSVDFWFVNIQGLWLWKVLKIDWKKYLKQVVYLVIVDLQKRTKYPEFVLLLFMHFNLLKKLKNCSWYEACIVLIGSNVFEKSILLLLLTFHGIFNHIFPIATEHGVSFTGSSLPICENCNVIALWNLRNILDEVAVDLSLSRLLRHGLVKFDRHDRERIRSYIHSFSLNYFMFVRRFLLKPLLYCQFIDRLEASPWPAPWWKSIFIPRTCSFAIIIYQSYNRIYY